MNTMQQAMLKAGTAKEADVQRVNAELHQEQKEREATKTLWQQMNIALTNGLNEGMVARVGANLPERRLNNKIMRTTATATIQKILLDIVARNDDEITTQEVAVQFMRAYAKEVAMLCPPLSRKYTHETITRIGQTGLDVFMEMHQEISQGESDGEG